MGRVAAQGDMRPMAGNATARGDGRPAAHPRRPRRRSTRKADLSFDTSGKALANSFAQLRVAVRDALDSSADDR